MDLGNLHLFIANECNKANDYDSKCSSKKKKSKRVGNRISYGNECNNGTKQKLELEKRGSHATGSYRQKTEVVESGLLEGGSKDECESMASESRKEGRSKAESESSLRAERRRGITKSSSCSSYYSLSSSWDLESDTELPEQEEFVTKSIRDETSRNERQMAQGLKRDIAVGL